MKNRNRSHILLAAVTSVLTVGALLAGLGFTAARPANAATVSVAISNYSFQPQALTVQLGDTVVWTNYDDAPHTITTSSGPAPISSPTLQKGQSFSFTFTKAGTYRYYCSVHPDMTGTITVSDTNSSSPSPGAASAPPNGGSSSPTAGGGSSSSGPAPSASSGGGTSSSSGSSSGSMGAMSSSSTGSGGTCSNEILVNAMLDPFINHIYRAHLERSPGQQANDLLNVNQYVLTHTVLLEDMVAPAITALQNSFNGVVPFTNHMYRAHLERSPGQQVNDALNVNQYVTTHTVLVEDMTAPAVYSFEGSYGC